MKITEGRHSELSTDAVKLAKNKSQEAEELDKRSGRVSDDQSTKVRISDVSRSINSGLEELLSGGGGRNELIESIKARVATGTYKPNSQDVAAKFVEEITMMIDELKDSKVEGV